MSSYQFGSSFEHAFVDPASLTLDPHQLALADVALNDLGVDGDYLQPIPYEQVDYETDLTYGDAPSYSYEWDPLSSDAQVAPGPFTVKTFTEFLNEIAQELSVAPTPQITLDAASETCLAETSDSSVAPPTSPVTTETFATFLAQITDSISVAPSVNTSGPYKTVDTSACESVPAAAPTSPSSVESFSTLLDQLSDPDPPSAAPSVHTSSVATSLPEPVDIGATFYTNKTWDSPPAAPTSSKSRCTGLDSDLEASTSIPRISRSFRKRSRSYMEEASEPPSSSTAPAPKPTATTPPLAVSDERPAKVARRDSGSVHDANPPELVVVMCTGTAADKGMKPPRPRKRPVKIAATGNMFFCQVPGCTAAFNSINRLIRHDADKHESMRYACASCNRTFVRPDTLKKHLLDNTSHGDIVLDYLKEVHGEREEFKRMKNVAPLEYLTEFAVSTGTTTKGPAP